MLIGLIMTPFGKCIEDIRRCRRMKQATLADLIGINPSYLCALEKGKKPPPSSHVIERIFLNLNLTDIERSELENSIENSQLTIKLPEDLHIDEYKLVHELVMQLGSLSDKKIAYLRTTLQVI